MPPTPRGTDTDIGRRPARRQRDPYRSRNRQRHRRHRRFGAFRHLRHPSPSTVTAATPTSPTRTATPSRPAPRPTTCSPTPSATAKGGSTPPAAHRRHRHQRRPGRRQRLRHGRRRRHPGGERRQRRDLECLQPRGNRHRSAARWRQRHPHRSRNRQAAYRHRRFGAAGTYGTLTLNSDGSYTYVADKANALASGATADDVFHLHRQRRQGGLTPPNLRIAVTGTNDAPVVGTANVSVSEEGRAGGSRLPNPADTTAPLPAAATSTNLDQRQRRSEFVRRRRHRAQRHACRAHHGPHFRRRGDHLTVSSGSRPSSAAPAG